MRIPTQWLPQHVCGFVDQTKDRFWAASETKMPFGCPSPGQFSLRFNCAFLGCSSSSKNPSLLILRFSPMGTKREENQNMPTKITKYSMHIAGQLFPNLWPSSACSTPGMSGSEGSPPQAIKMCLPSKEIHGNWMLTWEVAWSFRKV